MDLTVSADGWLEADGRRLRSAIGRGGIVVDKREGDGGTPVGRFPLRRLLFRADRVGTPASGLPAQAIRPDDGWCDAPDDTRYNRPVRLPYPASAERLWRADALYDALVVVGHNDVPVVPGAGSAIFLHVAHPDFAPTAGCVALTLDDLLALLARLRPDGRLVVPRPQTVPRAPKIAVPTRT